ncbi:MAG: type II secretion system F family protein [Candidatus Micrarchaeota archaeon]
MCAKKIFRKKDKAPAPYISTPVRKASSGGHRVILKHFFTSLASRFPRLQKEIEMAEMDTTPVEFVQKSFFTSFFLTIILELIVIWAAISQKTGALMLAAVILLTIPLFFLLVFNTALYHPRVRIIRRGRKIDQEIVFCGRHLLIELRSGVTLFDAMVGVTKEYGEVSKEFNKIVEKITLGVPASAAMHEVADKSPSTYFKRVVLQIANSITSGSDVADSLESVLSQVSKEQIIKLKAYGQKLNPLVMFYMLFGVIIPSLGVAFMIIVFSVIGAGFESMGIALMAATLSAVLIIQTLFLSVAENSRPCFDL